jgi:hypothetical protein
VTKEASVQTLAEVEQLMGGRDARSERAADRRGGPCAELSDDAHAEASRARAEIDGHLNRLRAMAREAGNREEEYRRLSSRLLTLQERLPTAVRWVR